MFILLAACTVSEARFTESPEGELRLLAADLERSDLVVRGGTSSLVVEGRSWGMGRDPELAESRKAQNDWSVDLRDGTLALWSRSEAWNAGVDFEVSTPRNLFTELDIAEGNVELSGLSGFQSVHADRITAFEMVGGAELFADGDVDAHFAPNPGDSLLIDAEGSVELELPPGSYDLQIWAGPESSLLVEDLGFHHVSEGAGFFAGVSGNGAIQVNIYVDSGSVTVRQGW